MKESVDSMEAIKRWDVYARTFSDWFDPDEGDPHRIVRFCKAYTGFSRPQVPQSFPSLIHASLRLTAAG